MSANEPKVSRRHLAEQFVDGQLEKLKAHWLSADDPAKTRTDARKALIDKVEAACSQTVATAGMITPDESLKQSAESVAFVESLAQEISKRVYDTAAVKTFSMIQIYPSDVRMHAANVLSERAAPPAVSTPPHHRWNLEHIDGGIRICEGHHASSADCEWTEYVPKVEAVSTPRCPPVEEIARVIYERAFDCRWAETHGIERDLWLEVAKEVAAQFFQPDSQPSPGFEKRCGTCGTTEMLTLMAFGIYACPIHKVVPAPSPEGERK